MPIKIVKSIDNYLMKFSINLPINIIEILMQIQNSNYITFAERELSFKNHLDSLNHVSEDSLKLGLTLEHSSSSFKLTEDEQIVKNYHELLLILISYIDDFFPKNKIKIFIQLDSRYPSLGSAISNLQTYKNSLEKCSLDE